MGKNQYGICTSSETATKQKHFEGILNILMPAAKKNMARFRNCDPYFWIYDLNAARSEYVNEDTGEQIVGSAVLGVTKARLRGLNYKAFLCELREDNAADLQRYFARDNNVTVLQGDNEITLPPTLPLEGAFDQRFGYVYVDPNDAKLPIKMLTDMFSRKPFNRIDLIVNIAAASVKRRIHNENYDDIALDSLLKIKKREWLVREPHAKHQWSLLVGTNWSDAPDWKKEGFYKLNTEKGGKIWEALVKTKKQQKEELQPSIFS